MTYFLPPPGAAAGSIRVAPKAQLFPHCLCGDPRSVQRDIVGQPVCRVGRYTRLRCWRAADG